MDRHDTPDDAAPDAFLRAALRHAPDRGLEAPAAVSAAILAAARRSVAPPSTWQRLRQAAAGAFAATRRPAVAGTLASAMLGSVVVLMWREGPPPEALPQAASLPPVSAAPAWPASASPAPESPAPPVAPADVVRADTSAERRDAADTAPPAARRREAEGRRPAPPPVLAPREAVPPPAPVEPSLPARSGVDATTAAAAERGEPAAPTTPAPAPAAVVAASPEADAAQGMPLLRERLAARKAAATPTEPGAAPAGPADPLAAALHPGPVGPVSALSGEARAAPHPARRWLMDLRALARGRWQPASASSPPDQAWAALPAAAGLAPGRVAIDDQGAWWQAGALADPSVGVGPVWHAPLAAAERQRLREAMAGWTVLPSTPPGPSVPSGRP